jgi:hypothetical protein
MNRTRIGMLAALALAGLVAAVGGTAPPVPTRGVLPVLPAVTVSPPTPEAEAARIRAHLAEVERELRARDVSALTAGQRAARARHIEELRAYREAGVFPRNHDFPGERVPYFLDVHGTHCAMAHLIARSGGTALVAEVAATRNNARVRELADDARLLAWLDGAGLSVHEAARIQPMYGWFPPPEEERGSRVSSGYAVATALSSGLSGGAIALNFGPAPDRRSRARGIFGVVAGGVGMALGASQLDEGGASATLGAVNAGIGLGAAVLGVRTLSATPPDRPAREPAVPASTRAVQASITPVVSVAEGGGSGVAVRVRF